MNVSLIYLLSFKHGREVLLRAFLKGTTSEFSDFVILDHQAESCEYQFSDESYSGLKISLTKDTPSARLT